MHKSDFTKQALSMLLVLVLLAASVMIAIPVFARDTPNPNSKNTNITYQTIPLTMQMEAGVPFAQNWWKGGGTVLHSGIGWIAPFGRATYVAVRNYKESHLAMANLPAFMDDPTKDDDTSWDMFSTSLFCVYRLDDGDIYAFDGVMGNVEPGITDSDKDDGKIDYVLNVIVGGTGRYANANGILLGRTPGRLDAGPDTGLPVCLIKAMEGYINVQVKKSKLSTALPAVGTKNPQKWPEALAAFEKDNLIPINLDFEAGAARWESWSSGTTMIAGDGWIEPFGRASYHYGYGFAEDTPELKPDFMTDASWSTPFPTKNLCIYHLEGGDIYAYDGIMGNLVPAGDLNDGKVDCILEVVVGGSGDYEGAAGMILGYTFGRGAAQATGGPFPLPVSIIKIMEGYIEKQ